MIKNREAAKACMCHFIVRTLAEPINQPKYFYKAICYRHIRSLVKY